MCAINGFNWRDPVLLGKMNKVTSHRGPDGSGLFFDENISLGHNRLSIIDTREVANQPMKSNDGRFILIFNGEIYNFLELRNELQSDYKFITNGDSEVILASYIKWGKSCVSHFNGIFSFAIWDNLDKTLFIARDPIGIKPLYYFYNEGKFIFSSEIKAILEYPIKRVLNIEAMNCYLRTQYTPAPHTMFKDINKLEPCHTIFLSGENIKIEKYTQYSSKDFSNKNFSDPKSLEIEINKAVERQLVSDRPLGIYLSGGIDSTTILHSVSKVRDNITTFSVGFDLKDNEQPDKFNQDLNLAKSTSKMYGTIHHEVLVSKDEVIPLLEEAIYFLDEPISNPTVIPMLKLARYTKKHSVVVLGGDGGDELFGGYERYRFSLATKYFEMIPRLFRGWLDRFAVFKKLNTTKGIEQFKLFMFQKDSLIKRILNDSSNIKYPESFWKDKFFRDTTRSAPEMLMDTDLKSWLVDESLMRSDKLSMASGVELRVPLLDLDIVNYSKNIPFKDKVSLFKTKKILKEAGKSFIPDFIINKPKTGWFSPGSKWLRDDNILKYVRNVLSAEYYKPTESIFNWPEIEKILNDHVNGTKYNFTILWSIIVFQIWAKRFSVLLK